MPIDAKAVQWDAIDPKAIEWDTPDPTEGQSFLQNALAGSGKAFADFGRGASQTLRMLGPQYNASADFIGLPNQSDISESRRLDAALMKTGGGKVGNIATNAALLAPTAGLGSALPTAAAIGAGAGLLQPAESLGEKALSTGLGAAGGVAGQAIANKVGGYVTNKLAERAAKIGAQKMEAARAANAAGYVIPPEDVGGGSIVRLVSGLSGKIKTAQEASARNQSVTNELARDALGLPPDAPLTLDVLKGIRSTAGQAYEAIKQTGTVQADAAFTKSLDDIVSKYQGASNSFPGLKKTDISDVIGTLKQKAFEAGDAVDATRVLREMADSAFARGEAASGKAFKAASDALEGALERHLKGQGNTVALEAFQEARKTIAKTYTVQRALNSETGDVSAQALASMLKRDKPLSGGLKTAAQVGLAFPKATQALKEAPKSLSPLDFGAAGLGLMTSGGNPLAAAGLLARPAARSALLSGPVQRSMLGSPSVAPTAIDRLLTSGSMPAGVLSGNALAAYLSQQ